MLVMTPISGWSGDSVTTHVGTVRLELEERLMATASLHLLHMYFGEVRSYFEDHPDRDEVTDLSTLRQAAEWARREAERRGELDALLAVIDFALAHDDHTMEMRFDLSLPEIIHDDEGYRSGDSLRDVLRYYRAIIWPESTAKPPGEVVIVATDIDSWRRARLESRT